MIVKPNAKNKRATMISMVRIPTDASGFELFACSDIALLTKKDIHAF
jgi:hypothetical protein